MICMKRILVVSLCTLLLLFCAACSASAPSENQDSVPFSSASDAPDSSGKPHSALIDNAAGQQPDSSRDSAPTSDVSPGATVVSSHACYDAPYCFRPGESGTYHFSAVTADDFQGKNAGYDGDVITWNVYVLSEPLAEGAAVQDLNCLPAIQELNSSVDIPLKADEYVYCVCSLNASTASSSPENAGTLTITPLDSEFLPDASNNYKLCITVNSESRCDLNGDGVEDKICYSVQPSTNPNHWTGYTLSLEINGITYIDPLLDNPTGDLGFWMEGPNMKYYYIVDLDTRDDYLELALTDWGMNDYTTTHYFRLNEDVLSYLGCTPGLPDDHTTVFNGDGSLTCRASLNVLQTWYGLCTYSLQDGQIVRKSGEFCQPELPAPGWVVSLQQAITVYDSPDLNSATTVLQPSNALSFPSTDGEHWVQIRCADGSSGWVYFSNFSTIVCDGAELSSFDVFGNLLLAG